MIFEYELIIHSDVELITYELVLIEWTEDIMSLQMNFENPA